MKEFTAEEIAQATGGELYGISPDAVLCAGAVTDSREVGPGDIYVARTGENHDGLEFAAAAVQAGAALVIAEAVPSVDGEHLPSCVVDLSLIHI